MVFIIVIFLITIKSESYTCNDENIQLLIVNEPTLSTTNAGDLESEDPSTVRSVNDTWATPVRLMSDDFTASGVASA
jgi:hypothetical protein